MSQCLPIPYSLFTSNVKLLLSMCHGFKNKKKISKYLNPVRWFGMEFKSHWHLNIWNFWPSGPAELMDWGVAGLAGGGEAVLALCALAVQEMFRSSESSLGGWGFCCSWLHLNQTFLWNFVVTFPFWLLVTPALRSGPKLLANVLWRKTLWNSVYPSGHPRSGDLFYPRIPLF